MFGLHPGIGGVLCALLPLLEPLGLGVLGAHPEAQTSIPGPGKGPEPCLSTGGCSPSLGALGAWRRQEEAVPGWRQLPDGWTTPRTPILTCQKWWREAKGLSPTGRFPVGM